jgi:CRP-like cAMP-binding protein
MPAEARTRRGQLERLLLLKTFPGIGDLSPDDLTALAENSRERFFAAGAEIFPEGKPVGCVHYVVEGKVEMRRGGQRVLQLGDRSVIGGLAALARTANGQQAVAIADTYTLEVDREDMIEMFEDNFEMLLTAMRGIARGFIEARKGAGNRAGLDEDYEEVEAPAERLGLVERLFFLHKNFAFQSAQVESLTQMAKSAEEIRLRAGERLWSAGDPADRMLMIVSGVVHARNAEQEFRFGPGGSIGGLGAMAEVPRWYHATAQTDMVALGVRMQEMIDIFEDRVDMAIEVASRLAGGLLVLREKIAVEAMGEVGSAS